MFSCVQWYHSNKQQELIVHIPLHKTQVCSPCVGTWILIREKPVGTVREISVDSLSADFRSKLQFSEVNHFHIFFKKNIKVPEKSF